MHSSRTKKSLPGFEIRKVTGIVAFARNLLLEANNFFRPSSIMRAEAILTELEPGTLLHSFELSKIFSRFEAISKLIPEQVGIFLLEF